MHQVFFWPCIWTRVNSRVEPSRLDTIGRLTESTRCVDIREKKGKKLTERSGGGVHCQGPCDEPALTFSLLPLPTSPTESPPLGRYL